MREPQKTEAQFVEEIDSLPKEDCPKVEAIHSGAVTSVIDASTEMTNSDPSDISAPRWIRIDGPNEARVPKILLNRSVSASCLISRLASLPIYLHVPTGA